MTSSDYVTKELNEYYERRGDRCDVLIFFRHKYSWFRKWECEYVIARVLPDDSMEYSFDFDEGQDCCEVLYIVELEELKRDIDDIDI